MAVTMKQIADDVGVSVVTVSKALRNHDDISPKTRALIARRARELGYRPNLTARSLVTGRSSLVGLLVPDLIHPFFAEVARSIASVLRTRGFYLLICSSEGDSQLELEQLEHLLSRRLDAIMVAPVGADRTGLEMVASSGTPLILLDREAPIQKAHFVGVNDLLVGALATEHLIKVGCKRIAHIRGPENSVGVKRLEGYKRALKNAGLPFRPELVSEASTGDVDSTTQGHKTAIQMLSAKAKPDGIFCFSDPIAMGVMNAALTKGVRIPKDLALIGCGNLHYDPLLHMPLSSIDQKSNKIGERAAHIVIEHLDRQREAEENVEVSFAEKFSRVVLRPQLVARASTQR